MVPIRRLTASNPARSPVSVAKSSAAFLNTGMWCPATTGSGKSSRRRREVHDAGDLVPLADVEEGGRVRGVHRLDDDTAVRLGGEVLGQPGGPVRGEHDGLAQVEQRPCGVRPDRTQAAGDEDCGHAAHATWGCAEAA